MNQCQVCDGAIDDDRISAAQSRGKTPRYCSTRCYRAGIKRTYRARRGSIAPAPKDEHRPRDERQCEATQTSDARPNIIRSAEDTVTLDEISEERRAFEDGRDEMRGHILRLAKSLAEHLDFPTS